MTMAPSVARFDGLSVEIDGVLYRGVLSPLARSIWEGKPVVAVLDSDPSSGDQMLAELVSATKAEIQAEAGGINYVIAGAEPKFTSPMQYGGHFLEIDRDLIVGKSVVITVIGGEDSYIDIISDLAETFLIWNPATNPVDPAEVAKMTRAMTLTQVHNFPTLQAGGAK